MKKILESLKSFITKYRIMIIGVGAILVILLILALLSILVVKPAVMETKEYNKAVTDYNSLVPEYNDNAKRVAVYNIEGVPSEINEISHVSESFFDVLGSLIKGNSVRKIKSDTETLKQLKKAVRSYDNIVISIYVPDAKKVCKDLKKLDGVTKADYVTEENDPDGLLGTDGGYTGCVYFSLKNVDQSIVPGDDVIAKGTDAGGAIEIYACIEDAEKRAEYLSQFDDTILYTGSYAVIGTMVVRTSYLLEYSDQIKITNDITKVLISMKKDMEDD